MRLADFGLRALFSCVAVAMLAGCGGSQPSVGVLGAMPQGAAIATPADRGKSWMLSEAKKLKELIYAGDSYSGNVYVYDYKTGNEVGALSGFNEPDGECVDKNGDVFITASIGSTGELIEYTHGGSNPIKTFVTDGHPIGCSIDPAGDLAVNNVVPGGGTDVEVWKNASGLPADYRNETDCPEMWPPGYDDKGNLFIETGGTPNLCELPSGSSTLQAVAFNHNIEFPGSAMWDGKHLTLTDQESSGGYTAIYRVKVTKSGVDLVGITQLVYKRCGSNVGQPFIVGKKNTPINDQQGTVVVGGNYECYYYSPISYWHYPASRRPFRHAHPRLYRASGLAVSILP